MSHVKWVIVSEGREKLYYHRRKDALRLNETIHVSSKFKIIEIYVVIRIDINSELIRGASPKELFQAVQDTLFRGGTALTLCWHVVFFIK